MSVAAAPRPGPGTVRAVTDESSALEAVATDPRMPEPLWAAAVGRRFGCDPAWVRAVYAGRRPTVQLPAAAAIAVLERCYARSVPVDVVVSALEGEQRAAVLDVAVLCVPLEALDHVAAEVAELRRCVRWRLRDTAENGLSSPVSAGAAAQVSSDLDGSQCSRAAVGRAVLELLGDTPPPQPLSADVAGDVPLGAAELGCFDDRDRLELAVRLLERLGGEAFDAVLDACVTTQPPLVVDAEPCLSGLVFAAAALCVSGSSQTLELPECLMDAARVANALAWVCCNIDDGAVLVLPSGQANGAQLLARVAEVAVRAGVPLWPDTGDGSDTDDDGAVDGDVVTAASDVVSVAELCGFVFVADDGTLDVTDENLGWLMLLASVTGKDPAVMLWTVTRAGRVTRELASVPMQARFSCPPSVLLRVCPTPTGVPGSTEVRSVLGGVCDGIVALEDSDELAAELALVLAALDDRPELAASFNYCLVKAASRSAELPAVLVDESMRRVGLDEWLAVNDSARIRLARVTEGLDDDTAAAVCALLAAGFAGTPSELVDVAAMATP